MMADLCRVECSADKVVLWVHVGNEGASPFEIDPTGLESITVRAETLEQECNVANNEKTILGPFGP